MILLELELWGGSRRVAVVNSSSPPRTNHSANRVAHRYPDRRQTPAESRSGIRPKSVRESTKINEKSTPGLTQDRPCQVLYCMHKIAKKCRQYGTFASPHRPSAVPYAQNREQVQTVWHFCEATSPKCCTVCTKSRKSADSMALLRGHIAQVLYCMHKIAKKYRQYGT